MVAEMGKQESSSDDKSDELAIIIKHASLFADVHLGDRDELGGAARELNAALELYKMVNEMTKQDNQDDVVRRTAVLETETQFYLETRIAWAEWAETPQVARQRIMENLEKADAASIKNSVIDGFRKTEVQTNHKQRIKLLKEKIKPFMDSDER